VLIPFCPRAGRKISFKNHIMILLYRPGNTGLKTSLGNALRDTQLRNDRTRSPAPVLNDWNARTFPAPLCQEWWSEKWERQPPRRTDDDGDYRILGGVTLLWGHHATCWQKGKPCAQSARRQERKRRKKCAAGRERRKYEGKIKKGILKFCGVGTICYSEERADAAKPCHGHFLERVCCVSPHAHSGAPVGSSIGDCVIDMWAYGWQPG
jgi:hypothetical protein